MIQVWLVDDNGFYVGESKFVEEIGDNMTINPLLVGYVKPLLVNNDWVEGATEEEIQAWKDSQQTGIVPGKTTEQKVEELISQVMVMDEIIASLTLEVL